MDNFEKLVANIMADAEAEGEPVTKEEAVEIANMEIKAKQNRHYEQAEDKKPKKPKERTVDEAKLKILQNIKNLLAEMDCKNISLKTETEILFNLQNDDYTIKLIRHRKAKGGKNHA